MNQNSNTGWIFAGILAVILIIVLGMMWMGKDKDIDTVLEEGRTSIIDMRAEVEKKCQGPEADEAACQDALADLSEVLEEFSEDVEEAGTTTPTVQ